MVTPCSLLGDLMLAAVAACFLLVPVLIAPAQWGNVRTSGQRGRIRAKLRNRLPNGFFGVIKK
jgi:uncharacterized OsmC-like protein